MNMYTLVTGMNPLLFFPFFLKVIAYGPGTTEKSKKNSDIWIWQLVCDNSHLLTDEFIFQFRGDWTVVKPSATEVKMITFLLTEKIIKMHHPSALNYDEK